MASQAKVYISYLFDSERLKDKVVQLADELNESGIDCMVDQYEIAPPKGWPQWRVERFQEADYVLLVCSPSYYNVFSVVNFDRGYNKDAHWEKGLVIGTLYNNQHNQKVIPIYFGSENKEYIPLILEHNTSYQIDDKRQFDKVYIGD